MDEERIQSIVDGFVYCLREELESLIWRIRNSAESALEEVHALGFTEYDGSGLMFQLADFGSIIDQQREATQKLVDETFEMLDMMDPEEEQEVRRRIVEKLKLFYAELEKMMGE